MKKILLPTFLLVVFLGLASCNLSKNNEKASVAAPTNPTLAEKEKIVTPLSDSNVFQPKQTLLSEGGRKVAVYEFDAFAQAYLQNKDEYTYVLNFWATWCGPCVAELPHFLELEQKMKDKKVKFVFVSFDDIKGLDKKVLPFLDQRKIDSEIIVLDQKGINDWLEKIDKDWSGSIPATLVYNSSKRNFYEQKFDNVEELEEAVNSEQ